MLDISNFESTEEFMELLNEEQRKDCDKFVTLTMRCKLLKHLKELYSPIDFSINKTLGIPDIAIEKENSNPTVELVIDEWIREIKEEIDAMKPKIKDIFNLIVSHMIVYSYKLAFNKQATKEISEAFNKALIDEFMEANPDISISASTKPFISDILDKYTRFVINELKTEEEKE